ncbi:MAG: hypothetical protein H7330_05115, partial [Hymenobacteraceae bacterium]|nr:hypothetical protein [Hymenobacteraceae bacterium]
MKPIPFLLAASFVLLAGPTAKAQGHSNDKDKDKKEYKYKEKSDDDKGKKEYKYKEKDDDQDREKEREEYKGKDDDDRYQQDRKGERNERRPTPTTTRGKIGEILGRVILPPSTGAPAPRRLEGIPRGHYPPPGQCRVWYPNRP